MTFYDQDANPRDLPLEETLDPSEQILDLQEELTNLEDKAEVFRTQGWALVHNELVQAWEAARSQVLSGSVKTMEEVHELRGRVQAYAFLVEMPERTTQQIEQRHDQLKELKRLND